MEYPATAIQTSKASHWIGEPPEQVVEKLRQALDAEDGTVGDLLHLTAVQSLAHPDGSQTLSEYGIWIEPTDLLEVRQVTEEFWREVTSPPEHPLATLFQQAGGGGPTHGRQPAITSETSPEAICCCEHEAGQHDTTGRFVGACEINLCPCQQFHTHMQEPQTSGDAPV